jgi:predicted phage-related endonuclease
MIDRAAWLEQRKNYLTASDVAAVMGMSAYKSRAAVLRHKTGQSVDRNIDNVPSVAAGRHYEDGTREWFAEGHPELSVRKWTTGLLMSPVLACLACTPDAIASPSDPECSMHDFPVELKVVGEKQREVWEADLGAGSVIPTISTGHGSKGNGYPTHYWVQLQVQMHCLSARGGWLVAGIGGRTRSDRFFPLDKTFESRMLIEAEKFWRDVLAAKGSK